MHAGHHNVGTRHHSQLHAGAAHAKQADVLLMEKQKWLKQREGGNPPALSSSPPSPFARLSLQLAQHGPRQRDHGGDGGRDQLTGVGLQGGGAGTEWRVCWSSSHDCLSPPQPPPPPVDLPAIVCLPPLRPPLPALSLSLSHVARRPLQRARRVRDDDGGDALKRERVVVRKGRAVCFRVRWSGRNTPPPHLLLGQAVQGGLGVLLRGRGGWGENGFERLPAPGDHHLSALSLPRLPLLSLTGSSMSASSLNWLMVLGFRCVCVCV